MYEALLAVANRVSEIGGLKAKEQLQALLSDDPWLLRELQKFMPNDHKKTTTRSSGKGSKSAPICIDIDDKAEIGDEVDDGVELTKVTFNALENFPHARHNCVIHRFPKWDDTDRRGKALKYCRNCYCFLCDKPVAECSSWSAHSLACDDDDAGWRVIRAALRVYHQRRRTQQQIEAQQQNRGFAVALRTPQYLTHKKRDREEDDQHFQPNKRQVIVIDDDDDAPSPPFTSTTTNVRSNAAISSANTHLLEKDLYVDLNDLVDLL